MAKKKAKVDLAKLDKAQIVKLMQERMAATKLRPISKIHPNPFNKNKMSEEYLSALKANIANPKIGFTTAILLRPHPDIEGEWMIVDGEHRWKACRDLGLEEILSIDLSDVPEALAKYLMLEQNAVRGATKDEDVKRIIQQIEEDPTWKQIMGDAFDPWAALVTDAPEDDASKYALDEEDMVSTNDATVPVTIYLTQDQNDVFRRITGQLRLANGYALEPAVMECVGFYAESTGLGAKTGDGETDDRDDELTGNRIAADRARAKARADQYNPEEE